MSSITLSSDLERALLRAVLDGYVGLDVAAPEELSLEGAATLKAIEFARLHSPDIPSDRPFPRAPLDTVRVSAVEQFGGDHQRIKNYVQTIGAADAGGEIEQVLRAVRDKQALVEVMNLATDQLANGAMDLGQVSQALSSHQGAATSGVLSPFSAEVTDGFGEPPHGFPLLSLPRLSQSSGGVQGVWVIAGEPGLGKSTLAWQVALEVGLSADVLYYDQDGTGKEWVIDRTRQVFNNDLAAFRKHTKNLYYRESVTTLDADLYKVPAPALIVIDSVQALPTRERFRRSSLDQWIVRLKALAHRGYSIVMVSEKARAEYGQARLSGFKETGELEYAASFAMHLLCEEEDPQPESPVSVVVVKNRHRPDKGTVTTLIRDDRKAFWFREAGGGDQWDVFSDDGESAPGGEPVQSALIE